MVGLTSLFTPEIHGGLIVAVFEAYGDIHVLIQQPKAKLAKLRFRGTALRVGNV